MRLSVLTALAICAGLASACDDVEPRAAAVPRDSIAAAPVPAPTLADSDAVGIYRLVIDTVRAVIGGSKSLYLDPVSLDVRSPERRGERRDPASHRHGAWMLEALLDGRTFAGLCHPTVGLRCDVDFESTMLSLSTLHRLRGSDTVFVQVGYGPVKPMRDARRGGRWTEDRVYLTRTGGRWVIVAVVRQSEVVV